jgi:glycosyl-4,4'-diaponeurosporenoate acyltransferase
VKSPPIELPAGWIATLNVAGWLAIQLALAWTVTKLPARWFLTYKPRPAPPRAALRRYERWFAVKRWKDRLPDGAAWFAGGFAKRNLAERDPAHLARFAAETRRGELCHWLAIACTPLFFLWNPWWGDVVVTAYALAANLPCIIAQRYNRLRLGRALAARRNRGC